MGLQPVFFVMDSGPAGDGYGSSPVFAYASMHAADDRIAAMGPGERCYYSVKCRNAYVSDDGKVYTISDTGLRLDRGDDIETVKRGALAKLSNAERRALGLE